MKLGKLPPRHDVRTLQFAKYVRMEALPPIPVAWDWTKAASPQFGMMGNDTVGDCTFAAAGHAVQIWTANAAKEITIPDKSILAAYSAVSGYTPGDPGSDQGANMLDVLNFWRTRGVGGHKIYAYMAVDPKNLAHTWAATYLFGGCYEGLALPLSAQTQKVWDVPKGGARGQGKAGTWGGHAVWLAAYLAGYAEYITWGETMQATTRFITTYGDERYAVLTREWIVRATQRSPHGFDFAALAADLKAVAA